MFAISVNGTLYGQFEKPEDADQPLRKAGWVPEIGHHWTEGRTGAEEDVVRFAASVVPIPELPPMKDISELPSLVKAT